MATTVPTRLGAPVAKSRQPINRKRPLFDPPIVKRAVRDAFAKLSPRHMMRNPVMFVVLVGSVWTTAALIIDLARGTGTPGFTFQLALWLWFTVLFANFAEAMAEGRGKAQAESLRATADDTGQAPRGPRDHLRFEVVRAPSWRRATDALHGRQHHSR
jgi:K+-transporting ATPase ATPase B chain